MSAAVMIEEPPNPETLMHHVRVTLKNAGLMQAITHEQHGHVVCSGYNLSPARLDLNDLTNRCRLDYSPQPSGSRLSQQQRMKIMHTMCEAYAAVLEAAGFSVQVKVGPMTGRPYVILVQEKP